MSDHSPATGFEINDNGRLYRSYGSGYFTDHVIDFNFDFTEIEAGDATSAWIMYPCAWALSTGNTGGENDRIWINFFQRQDYDGQYSIRFYQVDGGSYKVSGQSAYIDNIDQIYVRVQRSGTTARIDVYSSSALRDAEGDGDVWYYEDTSCSTDAYEYVVLTSESVLTGSSDHCSGYLHNLEITLSSNGNGNGDSNGVTVLGSYSELFDSGIVLAIILFPAIMTLNDNKMKAILMGMVALIAVAIVLSRI